MAKKQSSRSNNEQQSDGKKIGVAIARAFMTGFKYPEDLEKIATGALTFEKPNEWKQFIQKRCYVTHCKEVQDLRKQLNDRSTDKAPAAPMMESVAKGFTEEIKKLRKKQQEQDD